MKKKLGIHVLIFSTLFIFAIQSWATIETREVLYSGNKLSTSNIVNLPVAGDFNISDGIFFNLKNNLTLSCIAPSATSVNLETTVTGSKKTLLLPELTITASGPTSFCFGGSVELYVNTGNELYYQWRKGTEDIIGANSASYIASSSGEYSVIIIGSTEYSESSNTISVTVFSLPDATVTPEGPTSFCSGGSLKIDANTGSGLSYQWRDGITNISGANSSSFIASTDGLYNVKVTNTDGCSEISNSIGVKVNSLPYAMVTPSGLTSFCSGGSVDLIANTGAGLTYQWRRNNADIAGAANSSLVVDISGEYKVVVTNDNLCIDSSAPVNVTVLPSPIASFTVSPYPACRGSLLSFTNSSSNSTTAEWVFDNGNSSTLYNPTQIFTIAGNYKVKLISSNNTGCKDSVSVSISVWNRPSADFDVKNGCVNDSLTFVSHSLGTMIHAWTFGDGGSSSSSNPTKAYKNAGTYDVNLIITDVNGCKDTAKSSVIAYPRPVVSFTTPTNFCEQSSAIFTNTTTLSSGTVSHHWSFGDGNSSAEINPTNTYTTKGNYNVLLTSTSNYGCSASYQNNIIVNGKPIANFNSKPVCEGEATVFTNTTAGGVTYQWDFGDNLSSTLSTPTHTYTSAGMYSVKLTVANASNCLDVITKVSQVYPNPVANFTVTDNCVGLPTIFNNYSTDVGVMEWQFGDGFNSSSLAPIYTYPKAGSYNVGLSVKSIDGCIADVSKSITIYPAPKASLSINDKTQCLNGNSFTYTDNSSISKGTYSHIWKSVETGISSAPAIVHSYSKDGDFFIKLVAISNNGCMDSVSEAVRVYPNPAANFTINNSSQCFKNHLFLLTDGSSISSGSLIRTWNLGDGNLASGVTVLKKYETSGLYTIKLYTISEFGCKDSFNKIITVNPNPEASFTANNDFQCLNENSFVFTNTSSGSNFNSLWRFGDGNYSANSNATHSYISAGIYKVILNVSTVFGCNDSTYYTMKVLSSPALPAITGPAIVKIGSSQTYSVPFNLGSSYNWSVTNGSLLSNGGSMTRVKWAETGTTGTLRVTETATNGCSGTPANYIVNLTPLVGKVSDLHQNAFAAYIYPNPAKYSFTVTVNLADKINLTIYDPLGREVISGVQFNSSVTISDFHFVSGIYTIRLTDENWNTKLIRVIMNR